ncbi:MAG: hypothetical protein C5B51_21145 [Terriglobia bacterium]|nr:MAG: hypothetical protein C5B51_21145 [Terriglobia bacterium]
MQSGIEQTELRPWVGSFAGRISDPVVRLRFLRAVAPPPVSAPAERWRRVFRFLLPVASAAFLLSLTLMQAASRIEIAAVTVRDSVAPQMPPLKPSPEVWLVEKKGDEEVYSNGLRIDNRLAVSNHLRSYRVFPANGKGPPVHGTQPIGIVFHTTESRQAPFEAEQNGLLKKIGESLLEYVQRKQAYNFLVDRFGRVYRIVTESDAANHAGHSVWSDGKWLYLNLNESFLGVSVEAQTDPGQVDDRMSMAQLRATTMLTEMLRSRYAIEAENCVTHAQVSVNPSNMRVGYHTDWASGFPFESIGLPDNYARPLPALAAFGFESDAAFLQAAGARLALSVKLAEDRLQQQAIARGLSLRGYRKLLQDRYRERLSEVHQTTSGM